MNFQFNFQVDAASVPVFVLALLPVVVFSPVVASKNVLQIPLSVTSVLET